MIDPTNRARPTLRDRAPAYSNFKWRLPASDGDVKAAKKALSVIITPPQKYHLQLRYFANTPAATLPV